MSRCPSRQAISRMSSTPANTAGVAPGFTLLELLLVVCILGVLLATSMPRFAGVHGRLQLRELGKTLGAELRFCQEYSVAKGIEVRVTYLPGQQRFSVQAAADAAASKFQDLVTPWDGVLEIPAAVQVSQFETLYADGRKETNQAMFDPYGPAPTVAWLLQSGQDQVSVRYAGATQLTVVEE
jgi:prepilin-type N-terminal cleavage/methylation domain-containing protein